jgi:hypothetical protein
LTECQSCLKFASSFLIGVKTADKKTQNIWKSKPPMSHDDGWKEIYF